MNLDLALDIDDPMSIGLGSFKELAGPGPRHESHRSLLLLKQILSGMIQNEACTLLIGLETKFFGDKSDFYVGFVSNFEVSK